MNSRMEIAGPMAERYDEILTDGALQFITLAGFHALNHSMYSLARDYNQRHMSAYVELQEAEFASELDGYTATRHQREVGTGYFDRVATALNPGSQTLALVGSTESQQFH